jgi:hypothetical protein
MRTDQLFRRSVDAETLRRLLRCFGVASLDDCRIFNQREMERIGTVAAVKAMLEDLRPFYIPCKAKIFADPDAITARRCVTILRQFLLGQGYILAVRGRSLEARKFCEYQVLHASKIPTLARMVKTAHPVTVEF